MWNVSAIRQKEEGSLISEEEEEHQVMEFQQWASTLTELLFLLANQQCKK